MSEGSSLSTERKASWEDVYEMREKWHRNYNDSELQRCKDNLSDCARLLQNIHFLWEIECWKFEHIRRMNTSLLMCMDRFQALYPQDKDIIQFNSYVHQLQSTVPPVELQPLPVELLVLLDYFLAQKFHFVARTRTDRERFINYNLGEFNTRPYTAESMKQWYYDFDIMDAFIGMYGSSTYTAFKCSVHDIASAIKNVAAGSQRFWSALFRDLFGMSSSDYLKNQEKEMFITTFPPKPE